MMIYTGILANSQSNNTHERNVPSRTVYSQTHCIATIAVLSKVENLGSPNGRSTMDRWVVRVTFGWSVDDVASNYNVTTIS